MVGSKCTVRILAIAETSTKHCKCCSYHHHHHVRLHPLILYLHVDVILTRQ